jgi:hypothetical protein
VKTTQLNERQIAKWTRDWLKEGAANGFLVEHPAIGSATPTYCPGIEGEIYCGDEIEKAEEFCASCQRQLDRIAQEALWAKDREEIVTSQYADRG